MDSDSAIGFQTCATCAVCGSETHDILLEKDFTDPAVWDFLQEYYHGAIVRDALEGASYCVVRCSACGFMWQKHILDEAGLALMYDQWIAPEGSCAKRKDSLTSLSTAYAREVMTIARLIPKPIAEIDVLDFGMGWGHWCQMAQAFGMKASGIELSEKRCAHAASYGIAIAHLDELEEHQFDFINSEQTFEHIANLRPTAEKLARALKPQGVMRIAVPDAGRHLDYLLQPEWKARKDSFHPLEHINSFTHATLKRFGEELGLQMISRPYFPLVASDVATIARSLIAPLYYRLKGTNMYFRKVESM